MSQLALKDNKTLSQINLEDYYIKFINFIDSKPTTILAYTKNLKAFAKYLRDNNIIAPTREDIINFREDLKKDHKATTIQSYISTLKQFFKWLAYEGIYPNIADNIKSVKINRTFKKDYLRVDQVQRILNQFDRDTLQGKRDYAIISLIVCCGLRTIEVERATIGDLTSLGNEPILYILGKGRDDKSEYVKIPLHVENAIRDYLITRKNKNLNAPLFTSLSNNSTNHGLDKGSISRLIKNAFRKVGLDSERLTAHSLRHTTATLNLLNGGTLEETKQLLRHSNINTTMIYNHALERENNKSESRIDNLIFNS